jgi:hypothetical protein
MIQKLILLIDELPKRLMQASVVLIVLSFVMIYAINYYHRNFWQSYFYSGGIDLAAYCHYAAKTDSTPHWNDLKPRPLQKATIPHRELNVFGPSKTDPYRVIYYQCKVPTNKLDLTKLDSNYIHVGWVYGNHIQIYVNQNLAYESKGADIPVLSLSSMHYKADELEVEIMAQGKNPERVGLMGASPLYLTQGYTSSIRSLGIHFYSMSSLLIMRLLPILILSLVMIVGWRIGIRSRLLNAAACYFAASIFYALPWLIQDYVGKLSFIDHWGYPILMLMGLFYFIFGLELLHESKRAINRIYFVGCSILFLFFCFSWVLDSTVATFNALRMSYGISMIGFTAILCWRFWVNAQANHEAYAAQKVFIVTSIVFAFTSTLDQILAPLGFYLHLDSLRDTFTPLFVAGLLVQRLAAIQRSYEAELIHRKKMEHDLDIARQIQDSFAGSKTKGLRFGPFEIECSQIKHESVAGDWFAVRPYGNGGFAILQVDVTGKGIQAALVVHAIQSLWAYALGQESFKPEKWIQDLNHTLFTLGEKKPHTASLGLLLCPDPNTPTLYYYSMAHTPLFSFLSNNDASSTPQPNSHSLTNPALGMNPNLSNLRVNTIHLDKASDFLLGSDGVFERGSRSTPRELKQFYVDLKQIGSHKTLQKCLTADDRSLIWLKQAA